VFIRPEPPMDLQLCLATGVMIYVDAMTKEDTPEKGLRAVYDWIESTRELIKRQETENAPPPAADPMMDPNAAPPPDPGQLGGPPPMDPTAQGPDPTMDPSLMGGPFPQG
jgi:hypothetical protein